ncbi:MAG: hypothetical protein ACRDIB_06945, partial [Ardenticatenaceae bacterium]
MYGWDIVNDNLLRINKANGAGTIIGPLGYDANFAQGGDFDDSTGTLYLFAFNNFTFQGELRSADLTTGNTTFLGILDGGFAEVDGAGVLSVGSYRIPHQFQLSDGSSGTNRFTVAPNGTFTDAAGNTGNWVQQGPVIVLQYSAGQFCTARFVGQINTAGQVQGGIQCQDGSGVTGQWAGVLAP